MLDQQPTPPITPEMRQRALAAPNSWLHVVRPGIDPNGPLPADAVQGRYRVDAQGRITGEYVANPRYRPAIDQAAPGLPAPPITPGMHEVARGRPGGWIEVLDPMHDPASDNVPPSAVVGRYPVDANGNIIPNFQANGAYQPSPLALGWPEPANDLEAMMQLAHTGRVDKAEVVPLALATELILPADPTQPPRRHVVTRNEDDGRTVVDAFASDNALPTAWPPYWHRFNGVELTVLLDHLPESALLLLHGVPDLEFLIPTTTLVSTLGELVSA